MFDDLVAEVRLRLLDVGWRPRASRWNTASKTCRSIDPALHMERTQRPKKDQAEAENPK